MDSPSKWKESVIRGLTLEGAAARMGEDRRTVEKRVKALDSLRSIRARLMEVKKSI